ncbi:pentatricopeptide repeat-containing protein At1g80270, mitochondrial isoform X2 [Hevea brasiliensis]|uniref:pentatricopeptide repeat-containing protein At1g80270, mitochondrial isoform X2 n=1 Tax=Hevea brasiliensis TaxID=3981 RepID=UPI0025FCCE42|nr:pentatricopeptide repeat-containing protein At1g80270, mitochondrial isoform X2 [Hevea brasiliensis]
MLNALSLNWSWSLDAGRWGFSPPVIMWSFRRAALPLKLHGHSWFGLTRVISAKSDLMSFSVGDITGKRYFLGSCGYCSQAVASSENDKIKDGFLELGTTAMPDIIEVSNAEEVDEEELLPELEFVDDAEKGASSEKKSTGLELLNSIMGVPSVAISDILKKWAEEGNKLSQNGISMIIVSLKKRRMYWKALQFSEWLEKTKQTDLTERDYACRIDLIYRAQNLGKAEKFVDKIPESFKGELSYRTLLGCCVHAQNMRKAKAVFKKMGELKLPMNVDACNQMIILYKRLEKKKIADILLMMEQQDIKPSLLTYKLLIDTKGEFNDIMAMEQLVEDMKADGFEPDIDALTVMAKHYIKGGFKHKAETVLKEIEERKLKGIIGARRSLLLLYASLGRADKVGKFWKDCEADPKMQECVAAIEAWGKLGKVGEAEAVFDMMLQKWERISSRHYSSLLKVYIDNKQLTKGKDLVKRLVDAGCWIGPLTCDALVKFYIEAGDVDRASSILQKTAHREKMRPLFTSFIAIMEQYAKRGDVHNTEMLFQRMKEFGYIGRLKTFEVLIQAYINAKAPAYGFRERMKADKVLPNATFGKVLALADAFRKTAVSDIV